MKQVKCEECNIWVKVSDSWDKTKDVLDCPGCQMDYDNYMLDRG